MSFNDQKHCGLLQLTGETEGHVNDLENILLGGDGQTNDLWHEYWDAQSVPAGHFNDRAYIWLGLNGYTQNTLSERWYALWKDACDGNLGGLPIPESFFPLLNSLRGVVDGAEAFGEFTRAAGPSTVEDFEGVLHNCLDGEARFWRARRVENKRGNLSSSGNAVVVDNGDGTWNVTNLAASANSDRLNVNGSNFDKAGMRVTGRVKVKALNPDDVGKEIACQLFSSGGNSQTIRIILTNDFQEAVFNERVLASDENPLIWVYSFSQVAEEAQSCVVADPMLELMTGSQTQASEYVSKGVLSAPWHGANVDGVKYFLTDHAGNNLTGARGCLVEQIATNELPNSNMFDGWNTANLDIAKSTIPAPHSGEVFVECVSTSGGSGVQRRVVITQATPFDGDWNFSAYVRRDGDFTHATILFTPTDSGVSVDAVIDLATLENTFISDPDASAGGIAISPEIALIWISGSGCVSGNRLRAVGFTNNPDGVAGPGIIGDTGHIATGMLVNSLYRPSFIPTDGAAATRPVERLTIPRPAFLLQPEANDFTYSHTTFTVSDEASAKPGAFTMVMLGASLDNSLRIVNTDTAQVQYFFRKTVDSAPHNATFTNEDNLSRRRTYVGKLSSFDGVNFSINGASANVSSSNTDPMLTFDQGNGQIYIGANNANINHVNAGHSLIAVSAGNYEPNLYVNSMLQGGAASGPGIGSNPPTAHGIGFNTANSGPLGVASWECNPEEAEGRSYLSYNIQDNNPDLEIGATYEYQALFENLSDSSAVCLSDSGVANITILSRESSIPANTTDIRKTRFTVDASGYAMQIRAGMGVTSPRTQHVIVSNPRLVKVADAPYRKAYIIPEANGAGSHRGFGNNQTDPSLWYGEMTPDDLFGRVIWQWTATTNPTCVIAIANDDNTAATGQIPGVTTIIMQLQGYTPITYTWAGNRYEATDAGLFAYLDANIGNRLEIRYQYPDLVSVGLDMQAVSDHLVAQGWDTHINANGKLVWTRPGGSKRRFTSDQLESCSLVINNTPFKIDLCDALNDQGYCLGGCV